MKFPRLVSEAWCKTPIVLELEQEGVNEYGEPLQPFKYSGKCNYQDGGKRIYTTEKKVIQITGKALFTGDVCPKLPVITAGKAIVFGVERRIAKCTKARNPDGTVNYTEVLLE